MNKNISNVIKKFMNAFFFKIKEKKRIINEFEILKNYFNKIIYNLTELNQFNYFKESNNHYNNILKNIEILKKNIDSYSNINFKTKSFILLKIKNELLNYSNFVSSKKIKHNLLFINKDYSNYFNKNELDIIEFINEFVIITCFWISDFHKEETDEEYKNNKNKLILIPNNNSNNFFKSVFINSILDSTINQSNSHETYINNDTDETKITNLFSKMDIIKELNEYKIVIQKNKKANSLVENKLGTSIYIKLNESIIVLQGIFIDDLFNLSLKYKFVKNIFADQEDYLMRDLSNISNTFKYSYFNVINLRDKIILQPKDIMNEIKKKYNDFKSIQGKPIMLLINEFILGSKYRKIDMLTLFLMSTEEDQKLAFILFDIFKLKDKKNISIEIYNSLHHSIRKKLDLAKLNADIEEKEILEITEDDLSYEKKIQLMTAEKQIKIKANEKLKLIKNSLQGDSKAQSWLDGLLKIPFNQYSENEIMSFKKKFMNKLPVKLYSDIEVDNYFKNNKSELFNEWDTYKNDKKQYLKDIRKILDSSVYGHTEAKLQLERIFAQWINGEEKGAVLGLQGPPGTGKTSLAKLGLSKCLKDKNGELRPFAFIAVGGAVNGSTLVGHNYTYVGSTWGKIVDILITTKCMNPIIFIDELDKVSTTESGREIISILTHLTDSTQNDDFEDKFFAGVKLNLSKALIIFSFNDIKLIDPILKDRITIIETKPLNLKEKIEIIKTYMLPQICNDIGFSNNEILISDDIIKFITETYTLEAGVRKLKEKIVELVRQINLQKFYDDNIIFPFNITKEFCEKIFELKPKIKIKKIMDIPTVGVVNGLYANSAGLGGITTIQAIKFPSDKLFELNLTGSLGDVMKESINYALKLAINLLPPKIKEEIMANKFGIHLHCPEGGVKKDGPSAGAAITLALYSLLTNIPVNNKVALTGEIDLLGNITAIGGLDYKLNGAKKAGVQLVLYPEENQDDINILRKEDPELENQDFSILSVSRIEQIFEKALLNNI